MSVVFVAPQWTHVELQRVSWRLRVVAGVCFYCVIHVVPVKNEDGLVVMFILTFELQSDKRSPSSSPTRELRVPWLSVGKH